MFAFLRRHICVETFNASLLLVTVRWQLLIKDNFAKKRFSFVTLHIINLFIYNFLKKMKDRNKIYLKER